MPQATVHHEPPSVDIICKNLLSTDSLRTLDRSLHSISRFKSLKNSSPHLMSFPSGLYPPHPTFNTLLTPLCALMQRSEPREAAAASQHLQVAVRGQAEGRETGFDRGRCLRSTGKAAVLGSPQEDVRYRGTAGAVLVANPRVRSKHLFFG